MSRIVLLRHGRTAWNRTGRAQGHLDVDLDDAGREQAEAAGAVLARERVSRIWSSDLARAVSTAEPLATAVGLPIVADQRLREYDLGARAGLTTEEYAARFPEEHAAWGTGAAGPLVEGQETGVEVMVRAGDALRELAGLLGPDDTAVAVTHGGSAKCAIAGFLGWPESVLTGWRGLDNAHWAVLARSAVGGAWRLSAYNLGAERSEPTPDSPSVRGVG